MLAITRILGDTRYGDAEAMPLALHSAKLIFFSGKSTSERIWIDHNTPGTGEEKCAKIIIKLKSIP